MKVLIAGGSGLLGSFLGNFLINSGHEVLTVSRNSSTNFNVDFTYRKDLNTLLDKINPEVVINLICLSSVDYCEEDVNLAYRLNVLAIQNIAYWVKEKKSNTRVVHISTDHLYDKNGENAEDDIVIRNVYALSKFCGEQMVSDINAIVLRTNFFGPSLVNSRASFSDWLIKSLKNNTPITLFTDVFFNPLHMNTLSKIIELVMKTDVKGIYNVGSHDGMSKKDFAFHLAEILNLPTSCAISGSITDLELSKRPSNMITNCTKFEETFHIKLPTLINEIEKLLEGEAS